MAGPRMCVPPLQHSLSSAGHTMAPQPYLHLRCGSSTCGLSLRGAQALARPPQHPRAAPVGPCPRPRSVPRPPPRPCPGLRPCPRRRQRQRPQCPCSAPRRGGTAARASRKERARAPRAATRSPAARRCTATLIFAVLTALTLRTVGGRAPLRTYSRGSVPTRGRAVAQARRHFINRPKKLQAVWAKNGWTAGILQITCSACRVVLQSWCAQSCASGLIVEHHKHNLNVATLYVTAQNNP